MEPYIDFAVITALPIETIAVLSVFWNEDDTGDRGFFSVRSTDDKGISEFPTPETPSLFHLGELKNKNATSSFRVLVCNSTMMGGAAITDLVARIKASWSPRFFILVGIAMSFDTSEADLGDVIVPDQILASHTDKIDGSKIKITPFSIPLGAPFHEAMRKRIDSINIKDCWENPKKDYKVLTGALFSSNHVIQSNEFKKQILDSAPSIKIIAGEMEALGFFSGKEHYKKVDKASDNILVVKGISDTGGDDKNDSLDRFVAARNAAYVCKELIASGVFGSSESCNFQSMPDEYDSVALIDYSIWLSDYKAIQGMYGRSYSILKKVWDGLIDSNDRFKKDVKNIIQVAWRLAKLEQERGNVDQCLSLSMIALQYLEMFDKDSTNAMRAELDFVLGKVTRDVEMLRTSDKYFFQSLDCFAKEENYLGIFNANRWLAYSKFRNQNYLESYNLLSAALDEFKKTSPLKEDSVFIALAECIDMMSRCLRELAARSDYSLYAKEALPSDVNDQKECIALGIGLNYIASIVAKKSGNYFKIAESYLTLLYYFYDKNIYGKMPEAYNLLTSLQIPTVVVEILDRYGFKYEFSLNTELDKIYGSAISSGLELAGEWKYRFLQYSFTRVNATVLHRLGKLDESIKCLNQQIEITTNNCLIRPQERYRTFVEYNEFLLGQQKETIIPGVKELASSMPQERDGLLRDSLYTSEFFKSVQNDKRSIIDE